MTPKIYYKVVVENNSPIGPRRMFSSSERLNEVEYKLGEKAFPRSDCGPLVCFLNLESAIKYKNRFLGDRGRHQIYTCTIEKSKHKIGWKPKCKTTIQHMVEDCRLPFTVKDVVLADSITLLQKIEISEQNK
jgi:hypothetical protein